MPSLWLAFLDVGTYLYTIVPMILTPKQKQSIYKPYIEILQDVRQAGSISQQSLSEKAGLSPKYVALIESGKRVPSLECLLSLMAEAGVKRRNAQQLVADIIDHFDWKS